jgi:hypothetical protein
MGLFTYPCESCQGKRCPTGGHTELRDDTEHQVPCRGSNTCFESDCVIQPIKILNTNTKKVMDPFTKEECKARPATYDGYGRFICEDSPWPRIPIIFTLQETYEANPHQFAAEEATYIVFCRVWCKSCFSK